MYTYAEAVDYLLNIPKISGKNTQLGAAGFFEKLGNPGVHKKIVHVAGTNGKGSVCAYLNAFLREGGYHTGLFTSPHLVSIRERFVIDGEMISKEQFIWAFEKVYAFLETGYHPSFFEYLFYMAMILFEQAEVELILLETGLGGRLDATNLVPHKVASVITRIGLDHTEFLGHTLKQIAWEKAGIIKENTLVIYDAHLEETAKIIEAEAKAKNAITYPVTSADYQFLRFDKNLIDFSLHSRYYGYIRLTLSTCAFYQMENVAVAIKTLELVDDKHLVTKEHIVKAAKDTVWEGRMEQIEPNVFLDGAHNEDGVLAFLDSVKRRADERRIFLFSVVKEKNYDVMVEDIEKSQLFDEIIVTRLSGSREVSLTELKDVFRKYAETNICFMEDPLDAYRECLRRKGENDKIFVAGSLYLVGLIKAMYEEELS